MRKELRIRIRGEQHEPLDAELMAQIVVMLGRQLAQEAMTDSAAEHDDNEHPDAGDSPALDGGDPS